MRKIVFSALLILLFSISSAAQKVTLNDLIAICNKKHWEEVNLYLLNKGWTYYESKKGDTDKYSTITWSYNKDRYSDKAPAWINLFTFEDFPNQVSYFILNKDVYTVINNSIHSKGFKLVNSEINDDEVISTYTNSLYILRVKIAKELDDEWDDRSLTSYTFTITKKESVYDLDNGKKFKYFDNGNVKVEYNLKDGLGHGKIKFFYKNGQLSQEGTLVKGKKYGRFFEYSENGEKIAEYYLENDLLQGKAYLYNEGVLEEIKEYKNDTLDGVYTSLMYDESGEINVKFTGGYKKGKKNGTWSTIFIVEGKEVIYDYVNFVDDIRHGPFKEQLGTDTVDAGMYNRGFLDGPITREIKMSGIVGDSQEFSWWSKDFEGNYNMGEKDGHWVYYYMGQKSEEGNYKNNERHGKWITYVLIGNKVGSILCEDFYREGKKHGQSISYFNSQKIFEQDETFNIVNYPIYEVITYENGKKQGNYVLKDSLGNILENGKFLVDQKDGFWVESYTIDIDNKNFRVFMEGEYVDDLKHGNWKEYIYKDSASFSYNYYRGKLHGDYLSYDKFQKLKEKKRFYFGELKEVEVFDHNGEMIRKYDMLNYKSRGYTCRKWDFATGVTFIQDYYVSIPENDFSYYSFEIDFIEAVNLGIGYKSGVFKRQNSEDKPLVLGNYDSDKKEGLWTYFYYEEGLKVEKNYKIDSKIDERYLTLSDEPFSGYFTYVDEKEGVKEVVRVKKGLRHGKTLFIDIKSDTVIKKESYKAGALK